MAEGAVAEEQHSDRFSRTGSPLSIAGLFMMIRGLIGSFEGAVSWTFLFRIGTLKLSNMSFLASNAYIYIGLYIIHLLNEANE